MFFLACRHGWWQHRRTLPHNDRGGTSRKPPTSCSHVHCRLWWTGKSERVRRLRRLVLILLLFPRSFDQTITYRHLALPVKPGRCSVHDPGERRRSDRLLLLLIHFGGIFFFNTSNTKRVADRYQVLLLMMVAGTREIDGGRTGCPYKGMTPLISRMPLEFFLVVGSPRQAGDLYYFTPTNGAWVMT